MASLALQEALSALSATNASQPSITPFAPSQPSGMFSGPSKDFVEPSYESATMLGSDESATSQALASRPGTQPDLMNSQDFALLTTSMSSLDRAGSDGPDGALHPGSMLSASLYVKNLPPETTELFLYQKFAPHGALSSCKVYTDPVTGKCRGVGFVNFVEKEAALKAMQQLHGFRIREGHHMHITIQRSRSERHARAKEQSRTKLQLQSTLQQLQSLQPGQQPYSPLMAQVNSVLQPPIITTDLTPQVMALNTPTLSAPITTPLVTQTQGLMSQQGQPFMTQQGQPLVAQQAQPLVLTGLQNTGGPVYLLNPNGTLSEYIL